MSPSRPLGPLSHGVAPATAHRHGQLVGAGHKIQVVGVAKHVRDVWPEQEAGPWCGAASSQRRRPSHRGGGRGDSTTCSRRPAPHRACCGETLACRPGRTTAGGPSGCWSPRSGCGQWRGRGPPSVSTGRRRRGRKTPAQASRAHGSAASVSRGRSGGGRGVGGTHLAVDDGSKWQDIEHLGKRFHRTGRPVLGETLLVEAVAGVGWHC